LRPAGANSLRNLISKMTRAKRTGGPKPWAQPQLIKSGCLTASLDQDSSASAIFMFGDQSFLVLGVSCALWIFFFFLMVRGLNLEPRTCSAGVLLLEPHSQPALRETHSIPGHPVDASRAHSTPSHSDPRDTCSRPSYIFILVF
jgi:hypothetical protein